MMRNVVEGGTRAEAMCSTPGGIETMISLGCLDEFPVLDRVLNARRHRDDDQLPAPRGRTAGREGLSPAALGGGSKH